MTQKTRKIQCSTVSYSLFNFIIVIRIATLLGKHDMMFYLIWATFIPAVTVGTYYRYVVICTFLHIMYKHKKYYYYTTEGISK